MYYSGKNVITLSRSIFSCYYEKPEINFFVSPVRTELYSVKYSTPKVEAVLCCCPL